MQKVGVVYLLTYLGRGVGTLKRKIYLYIKKMLLARTIGNLMGETDSCSIAVEYSATATSTATAEKRNISGKKGNKKKNRSLIHITSCGYYS